VAKMKYGVWFHIECEYVTALVYRIYDRMQQRNHTLNAMKRYHAVRRKEMRVNKMKEQRRKRRKRKNKNKK
jgi:hypothetical protein